MSSIYMWAWPLEVVMNNNVFVCLFPAAAAPPETSYPVLPGRSRLSLPPCSSKLQVAPTCPSSMQVVTQLCLFTG